MQTIRVDEQSYRRAQLANVIDDSAADTKLLAAQISQAKSGVDTDFAAYSRFVSNATDRALWTQARSEWSAYLTASAALNGAGVSARQAGTVAVVKSTQSRFLALDSTANKWMALNDQFAKQTQRANASAFNSALLITIVMIVSALAIGAGIAFALSQSISKSVNVVLSRLRMLEEHCITYIQEGLQGVRGRRPDAALHPLHAADRESIQR